MKLSNPPIKPQGGKGLGQPTPQHQKPSTKNSVQNGKVLGRVMPKGEINNG